MKQELAPRGVGIPGLQAGEDVKAGFTARWKLGNPLPADEVSR